MKKVTILLTKYYFTLVIRAANFYYKVKLQVAIIEEMIDQRSGESKVASKLLLPSILMLIFSLTTLSVVDYITEESTVEKEYISLNKARRESKLGFGITLEDVAKEEIDSTEIHAEYIIQQLAEHNLQEQKIQTLIMLAETEATEAEVESYIRLYSLIDSSEKLISASRLRAEARAAPPPATSPAPRSAPVVIGENRVQAPVVANPAPPVTVTPPRRQAPPPAKPAVVTPTQEETVVVTTTEMSRSSSTVFPDNYFYYGRNNLVGRTRDELYEIYTRVYKENPNISTSHIKTALLFWYYQNFIELVANHAGLRPAVIAAMFRIEAIRHNGGETDLAAINNNCGGIKYRKGVGGRKVRYKDDCGYTENGEPILCNFAGYPDPAKGGYEWGQVLKAPRYEDAIAADRSGSPYAVVFRHFKNGGYWTAPGSGPINSRAEYARLYEFFLSQRK